MKVKNVVKCLWKMMIFLLLVSCKPVEKENVYLQKNRMQLATPRLKTDNTILGQTTYLEMGPNEDFLELRYTVDGSMPDENSTLYTNPINVTRASTYKVKAFHPDWNTSEMNEISFFEARIKPSTIEMLSPLDERYPGVGPETLINLKKGGSNFSDDQWIGVQHGVEAVIDFKSTTTIDTMLIGYFTSTGSWIFPPSRIEVFGSDDGRIFKEIISNNLAELTEPMQSSSTHVKLNLKINSRFIKIRIENLQNIPSWHEGAGTPGWLFMDEWIFN